MIERNSVVNFDYIDGKKEAVKLVLWEVFSLLYDYQNAAVVTGSIMPELIFPGSEHISALNIEILLNHLSLSEASIENIEMIIRNRGYEKTSDIYGYKKTASVRGRNYDVNIRFVSGAYAEWLEGWKIIRKGSVRSHFENGNVAFDIKPYMYKLELPETGVKEIGVISVLPYLMLKSSSFESRRAEDAYDFYFCIKNYQGGAEAFTEDFEEYLLIEPMCMFIEKVRTAFDSTESKSIQDILSYINTDDEEEEEMLKREIFERVNDFMDVIDQKRKTKEAETGSILADIKNIINLKF